MKSRLPPWVSLASRRMRTRSGPSKSVTILWLGEATSRWACRPRCGPRGRTKSAASAPCAGTGSGSTCLGRCTRLRPVRIARPDDGGVDELVDAARRERAAPCSAAPPDEVAGQDVGDVHLEDVGPLLLEERRGLALLLGLLVGALRLLAFGDLRLDHPLADGHAHAVDGGAGGGREDVDRLDRHLARVGVGLRHRHVGDHTGDLDARLGGLERKGLGALRAPLTRK